MISATKRHLICAENRKHASAVTFRVALLIMLAVAGVALGSASVTAQSQSDTIEISNWTDLDNIRDDLTRDDLGTRYVLVNDLHEDTPGYEEVASPAANTARNGSGFDPIGSEEAPFRGTFDGQGHTIRDLIINDPAGPTNFGTFFGLFGAIRNESTIKNVRLKNVSMTGTPRQSLPRGGGLVGLNGGTVANSSVSGTISGESVGGLVGINIAPGTVTNSSVSASVTGTFAAGGLVGANYRGTVSNSLVTGVVTGFNESTVVGGIVAVLGAELYLDPDEEAILRDSYYDTQATGQQDAIGIIGPDLDQNDGTAEIRGEVTGLNTTEMQGTSAAQNLEALDFTSTWQTVTDPAGYPELQALDIGDTDSDGDGGNGDGGNGGNGDGGNGGDGFGPGFGPGVVLAGLSGAGYLLKRRGTTTDTDAE